MNPPQSPLERDVASMIVTTLNLETVTPEQIDPAEPLFGTGLGSLLLRRKPGPRLDR